MNYIDSLYESGPLFNQEKNDSLKYTRLLLKKFLGRKICEVIWWKSSGVRKYLRFANKNVLSLENFFEFGDKKSLKFL